MISSSFFKKTKKALTLVEILVVILIIAILIVSLVPRITAALDRAKETQIRTDFRSFSLAAESVLREYSGFAGVPLMDPNGKVITTISEKFWNKGDDIQDAEGTPATQSLIKAMNRYLESNYQIGSDPNKQSEFGRSLALDPWKKAYEIYFVARSKESQTVDAANSDKIYIVCNGKTQNIHYPDYTLLVEYKNGEVRTAMAGFMGENYPADCTYFAGPLNNKQYVLLGSLFPSGTGDLQNTGFTAPKSGAVIGTDTLFNMSTAGTTGRLYILKGETTPPGAALEAKNAT